MFSVQRSRVTQVVLLPLPVFIIEITSSESEISRTRSNHSTHTTKPKAIAYRFSPETLMVPALFSAELLRKQQGKTACRLMQHGCRIGTAWKPLALVSAQYCEAVRCIKLDASNSSMNLLSVLLAFAAAKCRYSSNTEDRHHFCSFLRHPTTQPVRC